MKRISLAVLATLALSCALAPGASGFGVFGIKQNDTAGFQAVSGDARYVAFETYATNLGPGDADALRDIYVRDTTTGVTVLASRASGAAGAKANGDSRFPSMSADGRYVAFQTLATNFDAVDTDTRPDVYVRDLVNETTTLVSRATGAAGVKGNGSATGEIDVSADGRYIAFGNNSNNLTGDPIVPNGSFVRDMQTATTTNVGRADGPGGAVRATFNPSISDDGRFVAFSSTSNAVTADDTDILMDVFVRDLQLGSTTLVSRADGLAGAKGNGASNGGTISGDGTAVAFSSESTNLDAADADTTGDVYLRDLGAAATTLVSRATGASGVKGNALAFVGGDDPISTDGNRVVFDSRATNMDPADGESFPDVYVRDVQTDTTYLASRTATGTNSNLSASVPTMAAGGRYVSFMTGSTNMTPDDTDTIGDIYVRDIDGSATYLESRCCPGYARPRGATPTRVSLVPALEPCTAPNRTHGPPLAFGSCSPPQPTSDHLTVGTPDVNARPLKAAGFVRYEALPGSAGVPADDADVAITVRMEDVRDLGTLADHGGELEARAPLRLTDRSNGAAAAETGTMQDASFSVTAPCQATADTSVGATCAISTTADAVLPGLVQEGARAVWELGQVQLFDGGPDGDVDTAPGNTLFAKQGVFVP